MKRGIWPIAHARDEPVLERIYITIFDMARIISLIADQMLPKSALPDAAFVACDAHGAEPLSLRQRSREAVLDQPPARGKIAIARRQVPDRMQMIGQHDECADREGMALAGRGDRLTQGRDMIDQQGLLPLQQVDGEEPASARNERATIIRHETQDSTNTLACSCAADYAFG